MSYTYANIDVPPVSASVTGSIPSAMLLLTDIFGNALIGKSVSLSLYSDAGCTYKSQQVVISGSTATTNISGYANFKDLKILSSNTFFVGTTIDGMIQCSIKQFSIATPTDSGSVSQGAIVAIGVVVGLIFIASVTLALKFMNLYPFKKRNPLFSTRQRFHSSQNELLDRSHKGLID